MSILRAFPLSEPRGYYSVRDSENNEIGLIADPNELAEGSQLLVAEALERRYIVPAVTRILSAKERFGTVDWVMETDRGLCRFTTKNLREDAQRPAPDRIILSDIDDNRYDIREFESLDRESQALLIRHL